MRPKIFKLIGTPFLTALYICPLIFTSSQVSALQVSGTASAGSNGTLEPTCPEGTDNPSTFTIQPDAWDTDSTNPESDHIYSYFGLVFDKEGGEITEIPENYNTTYFHAGPGSIALKICKKIGKGIMRCFKRKPKPDPLPPARPVHPNPLPPSKEQACQAESNMWHIACAACECGDCGTFSQQMYSACMGLTVFCLSDEVLECASHCFRRMFGE